MNAEEINAVVQIEKIFSRIDGSDVALQPIINEILRINHQINVLQMLSISCEYENYGAQCTYLSIVSECVRVFEPHISTIADLRLKYSKDSLYYYLEFLLGCNKDTVITEYISGIDVSKEDMAYDFYARLVAETI